MVVMPRKAPSRIDALWAICVLACLALSVSAKASNKVFVMELDGALGVASAEYLIGGIDDAQADDARLIIIRMDTPGGLMGPMRDIVKSILGSSVPVVTYVAPGGARADSAGTYVLLASHVAAMAPTTHLGAATPVSLTGDDFSPDDSDDDAADESPDKTTSDDSTSKDGTSEDDEIDETVADDNAPSSAMGRKVLNDAVSYIRGLAEAHGRNADWAEDAVRNAATLTATEALEKNVIDLIANDREELLQSLNGREVKVNNETMVIDTDAIEIETVEPNWRLKILNTIASPEIAILLVTVGLYGLLLEGYNPGALIPGVVGVICLLLAAYALQVMPVNYAGLALIVVGMALIVAEAFAPSFGVLGLGGIAALIFGAIMMFDSGVPGFGVSVTFVVGMALIAGAFLFWLVATMLKQRKRGARSGRDSIVGGVGVATEDFDGNGHIWLESEAWAARSRVPIEKNQKVVVTALDGLTVDVEPVNAAELSQKQLQY